MTLPARYSLDRVPWGDCACCDSGKCAAHVERPDRDPPSRPTTAALVEKIERLYVRTLEERVWELAAERSVARHVLEGICGQFERTVAYFDWHRSGAKGMHAAFNGDFASVAHLPGVVSRMRWWVHEMRIALCSPEDKP